MINPNMKSCILGYIIKNFKRRVKFVKSSKARCQVQLGLVEGRAHNYVYVSKIMLRKKLQRHMSEIHGKAKQVITNLGIEEALIMENNNKYQCRKDRNNLHIIKLVPTVHFLEHNNVPVKAL